MDIFEIIKNIVVDGICKVNPLIAGVLLKTALWLVLSNFVLRGTWIRRVRTEFAQLLIFGLLTFGILFYLPMPVEFLKNAKPVFALVIMCSIAVVLTLPRKVSFWLFSNRLNQTRLAWLVLYPFIFIVTVLQILIVLLRR